MEFWLGVLAGVVGTILGLIGLGWLLIHVVFEQGPKPPK